MRTCSVCGGENPEGARFCNACGAAVVEVATRSRRRISVVFCDLVGSTELTERMDAEAVHGVMSRYWQAMREVVERHGGRVEKFIGDAVVAVFGVPQLHEDDALRAVRTANEMRDALEPLNDELGARWGVGVEIRAGVATGEVVASAEPGGPSVTGSALNLAARLEAAARPGEILLDAETWRFARAEAEGEEGPDLVLKGFEGVIRPIRLLRLLSAGETGRPAPRFVGRETELALLREVREDTRRTRRCRVITVAGDAGIGKTRLVREFLAREALGDTVLFGRCLPYGEGPALGPVGQAVLQAAGGDGTAQPLDAIASMLTGSPDAAAVASAFAAAVGLGEGSVAPEESLPAVRVALETLARSRPVVLVMDDVQWAEPALLDCVRHVAEWSRDAPLMIVCIARPDLLEARPSWGRGPGELTIRLDPLTEAQGRELALALLRGTEELERVIEIAGGNPFFLEEIVASLLESEGDAGLSVPPTISALLAARIDRLPAVEKLALEAAAVIGSSFDAGGLRELLRHEEGWSDELDVREDVLPSLAVKDFIVPTERAHTYRFRHELTREAAYHAVPKARRADLHERAAALVARAGMRPDVDALAGSHLERARAYLLELGPGGSSRIQDLGRSASARLASAGRAAAARGDVRTAASTLERAAALLPPGAEARGPILADLHDALLYSGETERAGVAVAALLEELGPAAEGTLAERARMQRVLLRFLEDPKAIPRETLRDVLDRAITTFRAEDDHADLATAYATRSIVGWLEGSAAQMQADAERGLALGRETGNRRATADAAAALAGALLRGPVPLDEVERRLVGLLDELAGDRLTQAAVRLDLVMTLLLRGAIDRAEVESDRSRRTLRELGQRRWLAGCTETFAEIALQRGRAREAVDLHRSVHASFVEQGDAVNARPAALALAEALLEVGEEGEADALASEVEREGPEDDIETQVAWRSVRARVAARRGDAGLALRLAEEATTLCDATDWVLRQAETREAFADVLGSLGRAEAPAVRAEARELFRRKGADAQVARLAAR